MAIVRRVMSACVRMATRGSSALSQSARQGGREKIAQNTSQYQAVRTELVQNHMNMNVKKVLKEFFVINQTVAMAATTQVDIVRNQESASAKLASKAGDVMSVCRTLAA